MNLYTYYILLTAFAVLIALLWRSKNTSSRLHRHRPTLWRLGFSLIVMTLVIAWNLHAQHAVDLQFASLGAAVVIGQIGNTEFDEIRRTLNDIKDKGTQANQRTEGLDNRLKAVEKLPAEIDKLTAAFNRLQKSWLANGSLGGSKRRPGMVSDAAARQIGALFIIGQARSGRLDLLDAGARERLFDEARNALGLEVRTALTTTDIPLPSEYSGEIRELVSEFGVVRNELFLIPIGRGTARPPRFKTRPAFGSIAMSASIAEKSPQIDFASLESHKIGGIVRVPREIDEQSIVPMGQFLARYGAIEFARAEDTWGFLADGSGTYETVKGIAKICVDNARNRQPAGASPAEMVIADFRALRGFVNAGALGQNAKYFLNSTMEVHLRTLNTSADPYIFVPNNPSTRDAINPQGYATLDGFKIVWTDVLAAYSTTDQVSKFVALFGVPQYWWLGEHGQPRMDFSSDVYFGTDELATRFIEEIDFDYQALDAFGSLQLAAS